MSHRQAIVMTCALAKNQDQKGSSKNGVQTERLTRDFITILAIVVGTCIRRYTHITAFFPGLPGWAGTRKVKPIWILLKQETVSGSGISWAICKSASRYRQITMPAPHHSVFYRPDALPDTRPTMSGLCCSRLLE